MAENRMADVAKMFGKELGEPFIIDLEGETFEGKFTEAGFKACFLGDEFCNDDEEMLHCLILGEAVIIDE